MAADAFECRRADGSLPRCGEALPGLAEQPALRREDGEGARGDGAPEGCGVGDSRSHERPGGNPRTPAPDIHRSGGTGIRVAKRPPRRPCVSPGVLFVQFDLKDLLQAIGPTASLVFAAWIFLSFLESRYVAA